MNAKVFDTRQCSLGEGPLWHPERQQLFWFDINGKRLLSRQGEAKLEWQFDEHVSAAGWIDRDTLLIASQTALSRFDIASGTHEVLYPLEADNPVTRSNDGRADPFGGFWIGTMGLNAEPGAGAIYRYHKGALECLYPGITISNAICFAPDGRTAYYTDTAVKTIMAQPLDAEGWPEGAPTALIDLKPEGCNPDGSVVDADGGIWNAQYGAGRVARYLPDGTFDRAIAVDAVQATCPAFGGAGLSELYITTARQGMDAPDESQGQTFVALPGVTGQAEHRVLLP